MPPESWQTRGNGKTGRSQMAGAHLPALGSATHIQHCLYQWLHQRAHCLCFSAGPAHSFKRLSPALGMLDTLCKCPATCKYGWGQPKAPCAPALRFMYAQLRRTGMARCTAHVSRRMTVLSSLRADRRSSLPWKDSSSTTSPLTTCSVHRRPSVGWCRERRPETSSTAAYRTFCKKHRQQACRPPLTGRAEVARSATLPMRLPVLM